MDPNIQKHKRRLRRRRHIRKRVNGTPEKPRLSVFRANRNINCQLIDDVSCTTIASLSTVSPAIREQVDYGGNIAAAKLLGKALGELAQEKGITTAVMDRGGYKFHGRVKAFTEAAREAGLKL